MKTTTITICLGKACLSNFAKDILKDTEKQIGCSLHDISPDGKFELQKSNCMANCKHGPSVKFNDKLFSQMTPKEVKAIIKAIKQNNTDFLDAVMSEAQNV